MHVCGDMCYCHLVGEVGLVGLHSTALSVIRRSSVRLSVSMSLRTTAAAAAGRFAAEVGRGQQISIDSFYCRVTCRPRKL